jgi:hypothetical protein
VEQHAQFNLVHATLPDLDDAFITKLKGDPTAVLLIDSYNAHGMAEQRRLFFALLEAGCENARDHRSCLREHQQGRSGPAQQHGHRPSVH